MSTYRQNHMIPGVDLSFEAFPGFLLKREQLLRQKLADLLDVTLSDKA